MVSSSKSLPVSGRLKTHRHGPANIYQYETPNMPAYLLSSLLASGSRLTLATPVAVGTSTGHFHWVGKIHEIPVTGWAMLSTAWAIAHPVNMLAKALLGRLRRHCD